jgi:hypothetical protein
MPLESTDVTTSLTVDIRTTGIPIQRSQAAPRFKPVEEGYLGNASAARNSK